MEEGSLYPALQRMLIAVLLRALPSTIRGNSSTCTWNPASPAGPTIQAMATLRSVNLSLNNCASSVRPFAGLLAYVPAGIGKLAFAQAILRKKRSS